MTTDTAREVRRKHWTIDLELVEAGDDTKVHAVLHTEDRTLESSTSARRSPRDEPAPEIGDEFAAGRALLDLGHQLVGAGTVASAAADEPRFG
ncbi:hypothetical protein ABIA32_004008 [Streptacidiphilus sp. MAP12-20]|uniref:dsRBD fold-containing protein n=1 Tax=Streptacidiphilus sp. MAP12-20 TaxID=3156299 RepID=UPI0035190681